MTEAEWLAANDLGAMAEYLWGRGSERKLRLLGCGCCRVVWDWLVDARSRAAVEIAERDAEEWQPEDDMDDAAYRAEAAVFAIDAKQERFRREQHAIEQGYLDPADAVEDGFILTPNGERISFDAARIAADAAELTTASHSAFVTPIAHPLLSVPVMHDIFGNPFRYVWFDPNWRTDTAVALARQMYESREFSAMPILADALQDAGCEDTDVLAHCRGDGVHVRGCWVVDGVLGKG